MEEDHEFERRLQALIERADQLELRIIEKEHELEEKAQRLVDLEQSIDRLENKEPSFNKPLH